MPMNKFFLYVESAGRLIVAERKAFVMDVTRAVQIGLSGKGMDKYMKALDGTD